MAIGNEIISHNCRENWEQDLTSSAFPMTMLLKPRKHRLYAFNYRFLIAHQGTRYKWLAMSHPYLFSCQYDHHPSLMLVCGMGAALTHMGMPYFGASAFMLWCVDGLIKPSCMHWSWNQLAVFRSDKSFAHMFTFYGHDVPDIGS